MDTRLCPAHFKYAFQEPEQFCDWINEHQHINGICMVGRSNVGKSSLINALFGKSTARTSKTPGRTREIIVFELEKEGWENTYLFDLPGYGHAAVSKEMKKNWNVLMTNFFEFLPKNILVINLQDARHPNQKTDKEFHQFLKPFGPQTFLALNKMDKLKTQKERAALQKINKQLLTDYNWVKEIHYVSAESGQGLDPFKISLNSFIDSTSDPSEP